MRGVYTANFRIAAVTAAKTLIYITTPSSILVEVLSTLVTDENNATNQQIVGAWQRITTLGTPTATTITPSPREKGDQAAASTVKANVTASEPTYGAIAQGAALGVTHGLQGYPSLGGYSDNPIPEGRFYIAPGDSYGHRLVNAITSMDVTLEVVFREIG